ncbi:LysR family transcriptional regulator [uncultured Cedecea sp.]|uniref:LysR family transcriptional regulator n=1 Tax=uncultured Cedecea sp. TaxID=988762 RepID=UPI002635DE3B|nr:LysR family transcriptional regulator [uncultured Cedecea sp.]
MVIEMVYPLKGFDFKILETFSIIYAEKSVRGASKRLGVTPSTISKNLAKLRSWYDDEIFVQTPNELIPTPFSEQLYPMVEDFLSTAKFISQMKNTQNWNGQKINLIMEEHFLTIALKSISSDLHKLMNANFLEIKISNWNYNSMSDITHGEFDIGVCGLESCLDSKYHPDKLPINICYEILFRDVPSVYVHKDHPILSERWCFETFIKYEHIGVSWENKKEWVLDTCLNDIGYKRKITLVVDSFINAVQLAANPEEHRIAIAPSYCWPHITNSFANMVKLEMPLADDIRKRIEVLYVILYHKRMKNTIKNKTIRKCIHSSFNSHC